MLMRARSSWNAPATPVPAAVTPAPSGSPGPGSTRPPTPLDAGPQRGLLSGEAVEQLLGGHLPHREQKVDLVDDVINVSAQALLGRGELRRCDHFAGPRLGPISRRLAHPRRRRRTERVSTTRRRSQRLTGDEHVERALQLLQPKHHNVPGPSSSEIARRVVTGLRQRQERSRRKQPIPSFARNQPRGVRAPPMRRLADPVQVPLIILGRVCEPLEQHNGVSGHV